jgi:DNA-binding LacI/PurR family transcriptional regulator
MTSSLGEEQLKELASRRIPVVPLSVGPNSPKARKIEINFSTGMLEAIDHLTALGHKKFGAISGPINIGSALTTRNAFLAAFAKRNLSAEQVIECNYRVDGGMSAVRLLLCQSSLPTAQHCRNDWIAVGAISALQAANLHVPEDISVVGDDDILAARHSSPPLTTNSCAGEELGKMGFEALEKMRRTCKATAAKQQLRTGSPDVDGGAAQAIIREIGKCRILFSCTSKLEHTNGVVFNGQSRSRSNQGL